MKYARMPSYLSPTALISLEEDPMKFYLHRCAPIPVPREPQNLGMAVGSAFDALVKCELDKELTKRGKPRKGGPLRLEHLLADQVDKALREQAVQRGMVMFKAYKRLGCLERLLEEGLCDLDVEPEGREVPGTARELLGRTVSGVPLRGHPDALMRNADGEPVVLDWKTTGGEGESGAVHAGWVQRWDTDKPFAHREGSHPRSGETLEQLNYKWATQLATYHWLLRPGTARHEGFRDAKVAIENVVLQADGRVQVARIRTIVTGEFQAQLRDRYAAAWEKLQEGTLIDPSLTGLDEDVLRILGK